MSNPVIRLPESLETRLVKKLVWNFTTSPTFARHVIQCSLCTPMKKATEKSRETTICWCLANQFLFILQRLARPLVLKYNCISWSLYLVTYTLKITKLWVFIFYKGYTVQINKKSCSHLWINIEIPPAKCFLCSLYKASYPRVLTAIQLRCYFKLSFDAQLSLSLTSYISNEGRIKSIKVESW